jgi:ligand-binding SRPBCC domain-containing protein
LVSQIDLETIVNAPIERCFDLARSVELHIASATQTNERAIAGKTSGLLGPSDQVTWEARHFRLRFRLTSKITAYHRPRSFRDQMLSGPFRKLIHDHEFESLGDRRTLIRDRFEFASGFPPLDRLVLAPYLRRFLSRRNETLRRAAEDEDWRRYGGG